MKFSTSLISGAGNTFHVLWKSSISEKKIQKKIAEFVCRKTPADGFIFLNFTDHFEKTYSWNFYNNDGSDAEMCGNATRCVGFFIQNKLNSEELIFNLQTQAGEIKIEALELNQFKIQMTEIIELTHESYFYCDTGVPHIVIDFADFKNYLNYKNYCKDLRFHSDFQPRGTNITLVTKTDDLKLLKAVSYERGVEDFTQACGTGAMAAAFFNYKKTGEQITTIEMPGGTLRMNLENLKKPLMIGPAILLGDYEYEYKI